MAEYIEKEMALKLIADRMDMYGTYSVERSIYMTARQKIKNIPAADVAPVVHGKWIFDHMTGNTTYYAKCSECGTWKHFASISEQDEFCSKCGAKMDLEEQGKE